MTICINIKNILGKSKKVNRFKEKESENMALSINVSDWQYQAIADCLKKYLNFRDKFPLENEHLYYKVVSQQGLKYIISNNLIDLVRLSKEILQKHSTLIPTNILLEIGSS